MGFLIKPLQWVATWLLTFFSEKLIALIKAKIEESRRKSEIEAANKAAREQTERAETPQEREDAAQNIINRF